MTSRESLCHWCCRTSEMVGHALLRCGGCKILHYCQRNCQRSDWKHHKEECQSIQAGGEIPRFRRGTVRVNGATMLHPGDMSAFTPDSDTVYYTKTSKPHIYDVSVAGPFYPMESIIEHIERRCIREGSLPALPMLHDTIERLGIVSLEHVIAPLPGGHHMTIQVVREKNIEVAAFLRGCPPHTPRPVYPILKQTCHPDLEALLANDWPHDYVPTLDQEVIASYLSKDKANEEARKILGEWEKSKQPEERVLDMMHEGMVVGQLRNSMAMQKQILLVSFDDGKVNRNGVWGY